MLHNFPTEFRSELRELTFVRVLEYFEGDILSEYKAARGNGLYLEKWCDREGQINRWLVVRSDHRALAEYLAGKISMYTLMTCGSDGGGFIVDRQNGTNISVFAIRLNNLPPKYMPDEDAFHDEELRPVWAKTPQSFLVGDNWDAEMFAKVEKKYLEVASFTYFSKFSPSKKLPPSILSYYYDGGFAVGTAYRTMRGSVPRESRVNSVGVFASSPGVLTLEAPAMIANHIAATLSQLKNHGQVFKQLHQWSRLKPVAFERVPENAFDDLETLCTCLDIDMDSLFPDPTEFNPNPKTDKKSILAAGKLIASHWKRLWNVLKPGNGVEFISVNTIVDDAEVPEEVFTVEDDDPDTN